jgi:hypothetical protein
MTIISVTLFVALVGAAFLGRRVRRYLPEDHLSADSKDAVKLAMGLVATMTALVLGLLVSSAKGTYDTARSEVIQMAAKVALLDRVLALYGPEAAEARGELRGVVADAVRRIWSTDPGRAAQLAPNQQAGDDSHGGSRSDSVTTGGSVDTVHFEANAHHPGLVARGHLLWLQPAGATQRHDHASPGRLCVLSCRRHFPDSRTGPTFWRPDTNSKRTDDKRLKPLGEVRRVKRIRIV